MILLRAEKFGGIIFNTLNGHELWLDQGLYSKISDFILKKTVTPLNDSDLQKIFLELAVKEISKYKIYPKIADILPDYPFKVLNSPILADINITGKCNLHCGHCYINSSNQGQHMSLSDFELALNECQKAGVMQIALGGGEPTLHPNFPLMLKKIHQANIVPNLTTNGYKLGWRNAYAIARYTGAVALSVENIGSDFEKRRGFPFSAFEKNIIKLKTVGVKIVFQITVSQSNLDTIEKTITYLKKYKPYGFLFLAYKPQGRGLNFDKPLADVEYKNVKQKISNIFAHADRNTKIGFDCCFTPALMSLDIKDKSSFQGCTASRTSIGIMPNLDVMPCSFLHKNTDLPNLKQQSLLNIWQGNYFGNFRNKIDQKSNNKTCSLCSEKSICLGGCSEFELTKCESV